MITMQHILFPVDFSERCLKTAPFVQSMAKRFGAKVTLLSAVQPVVAMGSIEGGMPMVLDVEDLRSAVAARLDQTLNENWNGVTVERVVEVGEPAQAITEFAHNRGVSLIMMPTHGYGPFRRLLLGSVTSKVLHDSHAPIWTDAHVEDPDVQRHIACRTVICAVDRNPDAGPLMRWASNFSAKAGASLRLVHAIGGAEAFPERQFDREFQEALREQAKNEIEQIQRASEVDASLCIVAADVATAIRQEARGHAADLVVIGRGSIHATLGRLRTHAHAIIRHSPCPVISV